MNQKRQIVAVSTSSFASHNRRPLEMLEEAGYQVRLNPHGRRLSPAEAAGHLEGAVGLLAGLESLSRQLFSRSPELRAIARVGIGMDSVDTQAADDLGIRVSNTPDGPTEAVAEMCLTALLTIGRGVVPFNHDLHQGVWKKRVGWGVRGTVVLLIGFGRIGREFNRLLQFFGAKVLVHDPYLGPDAPLKGAELVDLEAGLARAQVVSLHASGTDCILDGAAFARARRGMVLLNAARGGLVDENALEAAVREGTVSTAWLDCFADEPYSGSLASLDQVLMTPHISTYTRQCRQSMESAAVENLLRDLGVPSGRNGD